MEVTNKQFKRGADRYRKSPYPKGHRQTKLLGFHESYGYRQTGSMNAALSRTRFVTTGRVSPSLATVYGYIYNLTET